MVGRITRKMAAEVAEALHVDEDVVLNMQEDITRQDVKERLLQQGDRAPLGSLEPNSTDSHSQPEEVLHELRKSTRTRAAGKKTSRDNMDNLAADPMTASKLAETPLSDEQHVLPKGNAPILGLPNVTAAEDLTKESAQLEITHLPLDNSNTAKHHSPAVNDLTGAQQLEPKSLVDGIGQTREELDQEYFSSTAIAAPGLTMGDIGAEQETGSGLNLNAPASPVPTAVPNVVAHLRSETPAKRSTSNKENIEPQDVRTPQPSTYDALETAAVTAATPPPAPAADPITALDALEEAVESVKNDIPDVQSSPEKPKRTSESTERKVVKKAAPVVRATKASQARISLAQNPEAASKPPALGRPRPSTLARSASVRQSSAGTLQTGSNHSPPAVVAKREVIIPHSKPRPVSLSFPTPPQPMKSTKAPTQSTFQLPGEAVAAKLKAAKEARQQKELDEAGQKKAFKARPVPASLSRAPSVRHTNASKARESLMSGKDLRASTAAATAPGAVAAHRRVQSVATALNPRVLVSHSTLSASTLGASTTASSKPSAGRLSTASTAQRPRPSLAPASSFNPTASTQRPTTTTAKGKEVFNRPAAAKAAAEKAKSDKEAAAKKARAEAAERGRAASREWAEKQKRIAAAKKEALESAKEGGQASVGVVL